MLSIRHSRVGRPALDLDEFQQEITALFIRGQTSNQIALYLDQTYSYKVHARTIQRRLNEWHVSKRRRNLTTSDINIKIQVKKMFHEMMMTDKEMQFVLQKQDIQIGLGGLKSLRSKLGLRRHSSREQFAQVENELRAAVQEELDKGEIEGYGRRRLNTYFRSKQHIISRDRLFQLVKELDTAGVTRRHSDLQPVRGDSTTPGPNYLWSIDGYDKLSFWGFQLYAGIDVYSRYITWIYVGNSNRTGFSVLRQYLDTLNSEKKQPRFVRSDKGGETTYLATAHHALYQRHDENATLSDCYLHGTSMSTQRSEGWWSQLTKGLLFRWRDYFQRLTQDALFVQNHLSDRISILAVYMPLVRTEIWGFVRLWNVHSMHSFRKLKEGPNGVSSKPYFLYHYPEDRGVEDYGILPNQDFVEGLLNSMGDWDIDEYLPEETRLWCEQKLNEMGFASLTVCDAFPDNIRRHCEAYIKLRECVKAHMSSNEAPLLAESPTPTQEHISNLRLEMGSTPNDDTEEEYEK